jgi:hypothetical protein
VAFPFSKFPEESKSGITTKVLLFSWATVTLTGVESLGAFVPSPE